LKVWAAAAGRLKPHREGLRRLTQWEGSRKRQLLCRGLWRWHDVVVEIGMRLYAEARAAEHATTIEQVSAIRAQLEHLQQQRVAELAEQQEGHAGLITQLDDDWRQVHPYSDIV
jgi:hypothetical protein